MDRAGVGFSGFPGLRDGTGLKGGVFRENGLFAWVLTDFWLVSGLSFPKIVLSNAKIVPSVGLIVHLDGEIVPSDGAAK
jgi:hypothetical protein